MIITLLCEMVNLLAIACLSFVAACTPCADAPLC